MSTARALVPALLATGCALHPVADPPAPTVPVPDAWSQLVASVPREPGTPWWEALGDAELDTLIGTALSENLTVGRALARVSQADALLRQDRSLYRPQLDAVGEYGLLWDEDDHGQTETRVGGALSWEIDLFGRLRSAEEARASELAATAADLEAVRLLVSGQVAEAWYGAVEQQLQLALLREQRERATTLVELTELRFLQGDASAVDVLQQRSVLEEVASEEPLARARLRAFENRLDVLLGEVPDGRPRTGRATAQLPAPENVPPLDVPAELLVHRPDLRALARLVVASDHRIAEAIADRLPRITLTGSAGWVDPATGGAGAAASLFAGLVQPLVDWGRRRAAVDYARAFQEESLLEFSEAYLVAIEEVETTLWQERQERDLVAALSRRVDVLERTVEGTRWRYVQGITDYLPVLTAVRELQAAQRELLTRRRELVSLRIQLYRALGGAVPPTTHARTDLASGGDPGSP